MADTEQWPKVGVGIIIFKDGKILLHKRKGSHGQGEYAFPGGHLEYMESFEDCARREIKEECGVEVKNIRFNYVSSVLKYAPKHYVHMGLIADWEKGEPKTLEPEKCDGDWEWYDLNNLPEPMFELCKIAIRAYKENKNYFNIIK
jgi:8-oxo-dGTP diphosphatase